MQNTVPIKSTPKNRIPPAPRHRTRKILFRVGQHPDDERAALVVAADAYCREQRAGRSPDPVQAPLTFLLSAARLAQGYANNGAAEAEAQRWEQSLTRRLAELNH